MVLDVLHILPTDRTPEVLFEPGGNLRIKGRGFRTDIDIIPNEIMSWINKYVVDPADETNIHIAFEYMNSASTRALMDMLKSLSVLKLKSKKLNIKWYYESDDHDILERGEFIENSLNIPIEFIALPNH
jgi:hypothetical protein